MLQLELYNKSSDLYELEFIKQKRDETLIICPGPGVADAFRTKIKSSHRYDVVTVSKFISDEFCKAFTGREISSKANMLLNLGTVFKKIFPTEKYETFFTVFDSFTELRGFTVNIDLVEEILGEFPGLVAKAIALFWHYTEEGGLIDEHKAYYMLSEAYRSIEHEVHPEQSNITISKNIIFWGFKHLSAGQIDLLKAMSIRHDVYVPCAGNVYHASNQFDWVRWLAPDLSTEEYVLNQNYRYVPFARNRLGETIRLYSPKADAVFLALQNPEFNHINEIPYEKVLFKSDAKIFDTKMEILKEQVAINFRPKERYHVTDVVLWIEKEALSAIRKNDFRLGKVYSLLKEVLQEYRELSDINENISGDDFKLLFQITMLKLPRVFCIPMTEKSGVPVRGIESLEMFSESEKTFVCVTSEYSPLYGQENRYSERMMAFLKEVGPIRRAEFVFQVIKHQMLEILASPQTILFIENGLKDHDLGWDKILGQFEAGSLEVVDVLDHKISNKYDFSLKKRGGEQPTYLSATRLQSYIDCPRQYYLKYIEQLQSRIALQEKILPFEIGEIEHSIIEKYFVTHQRYDGRILIGYVEESLEELMASKEACFKEIDLDSYTNEIVNYCRNGLMVLYQMKSLLPSATFRFEVPLEEEFVSGRIDCLVEIEGQVGILDFKRSSSSVPTRSEIRDFKKIQSWFYVNHVKKTVVFSGFLNLSDPQDSTMVLFDFAYEEIFSTIGLKAKMLEEVSLNDYREFEKNIIERLNKDETFKAIPSDGKVCSFCILKATCSKGNQNA